MITKYSDSCDTCQGGRCRCQELAGAGVEATRATCVALTHVERELGVRRGERRVLEQGEGAHRDVHDGEEGDADEERLLVDEEVEL